jgi:hypothetical protein
LNFLAALGKLLPFFPGHRLELHGTVFSSGQLINGGRDRSSVWLGRRRVRTDISLGGPSARGPVSFVIAAILVGCLHTTLPIAVPAMLPALTGIKRVVAMTAGLK